MRKFIRIIIAAALLTSIEASGQEKRAVDYVNPLIGTMSCTDLSCGNTYPAISVPFGMHNWAPHTGKMADGWAYTYQTNYLQGFKQTHQPSLWISNYGQFSIMPVTDPGNYTEDKRRSWYSHKTEIAKPYYYKVYLGDPQAYVEMTATERAAKFRITYNGDEKQYLVLDAFRQGAYVRIIPEERKIVGYASNHGGGSTADNFRNYFVLTFDKPFTTAATWDEDGLKDSVLEMKSGRAGAVIGFDIDRGDCVNIDIASSYISEEQAELNMKEVEGKTFEAVRNEAADSWEKQLGRIKIEANSERQLETFYSAYYRMLIYPRKFYELDADGKVCHYSPYTGKVLPGYMYADNGFWDTFRTEFPFLTLMHPTIVAEVMKSLENIYKESGWLPEWFSPGHINCMIGSHSASVITDAYLGGIEGMDIDLLYEAILKNTENEGPVNSVGRLGAKYYNEKGYIPYNVGINQDASRTLEYAYDDYCIMQLAKALNRPEQEVALFRQRSQHYRNLYDPETGLMRPRGEDGAFQAEFDPFRWGDHFTEANSWQYTWFVPQDVEGLKALMGGDEAYFKKMDYVFTMPQTYDISYYNRGIIHLIREMQSGDMGQYSHHNEPMHHMLYMFDFGQPWKTQYWVRNVMDHFYTAAPDGYLGEEDNGQMSAWYVMSSLGIYPLTPCSGQYVFGSPLFRNAKLTLENGRVIEISAPGNTAETVYVDQIKVNGHRHPQNFVEISELKKGTRIKFIMSAEPNTSRGTRKEDYPYSVTTDND